MTRHRRELLDVEAQVADASRADRDEHRAAARFDRRELVRVAGAWVEADRVPHPSDVIDEEAW